MSTNFQKFYSIINEMRKFAERLKELRLEKGLSMQGLANEIGCCAASVFQWEKGIIDISSDNLIKIAKFFNVSADYLLGLKDE